MENIELTSEEKEELERRGFLTRKNYLFSESIKHLMMLSEFGVFGFIFIGAYTIIFLPILLHFLSITGIIFIGLILLLLFIGKLGFYQYIGLYVKSGVTFFMGKRKLQFGEITGETYDEDYFSRIFIFRKTGDSDMETSISGHVIMLFIFLILASSYSTNNYEFFRGFFGYCLSYILMLLVSYITLVGMQYIFQLLNPLYAFGNIGEKIQKLTPEIESQSKIIQSEFERDQNFSILHSGFEKLATTFSRIGELILKLERVEKKANKGNLFDSEKYISSLRTDIVTPLAELKKFLEGQREELLQSQKELSKVMVGESSELSGNRELATKRGEEILRELDGNIGKLDIMITKIA